MKRTSCIVAAAAALLFAGAASSPGHAAIKCQGPDQVNSYGLIRTPYCEDNYLAYVASHHHGMSVSAKAIRHNPNYKEDVCRRVGHDIRVKDICIGFRPEFNGRFR